MPEELQNAIGYQFENGRLLEEALTHASSADSRLNSNERMEFLGDSILGYVVCEYLYHSFPELLEGEMTKIKSAVVSRRVCAEVATNLGLQGAMNLGKGMGQGRALPLSVQAAVFESIIAAVYLDGGMEPTRKFILDQLRDIINHTAESTHQQNFKSVLQHYTQRVMPSTPSYVLLDEKGPDHAKCFEVCVEVDGKRFPSAWAKNKKEAEQQAALKALYELEIATVDDDGNVHVQDVTTDE